MKNNIFILSLLLLFTAACTHHQQEEQAVLENQKILDYLTNTYGFLSEDIRETDDAFIAEGDLVFPKEEFWENYGTDAPNAVDFQNTGTGATDRKHYRANYTVSETDVITLNIKPGIPDSWEIAIEDAVEAWNNLYGGLYFEVIYSNSNTDKTGFVNIAMNGALDSNTAAETLPPSSSGLPGKRMQINPKYNGYSVSFKTHVIAHEIGHAIGFRHTDKGLGTLIIDVSSACRNYTDSKSIMRATLKDTDLFLGFTSCDVEAYDALYWW